MPKSQETLLAFRDAVEPALDLHGLAEGARALVAAGAPEDLERAFLERAAELAGCDVFARFALADEALRVRATGGVDVAAMRTLDALMLSEHPCGPAIAARAAISVDAADVAVHVGGNAMRGLGARAYVTAPLVTGDRVLGALVFASTQRDALSTTAVSLATLASSVVAAAIGQSAAAEELGRTQARMRNFLDHATDAMFVQDVDGTILDVNRQACESLGYTREELIGKPVGSLDPVIKPEQIAALVERLDAGDLVSFDSQHRRKGGALFPVEVRVQRFREDGRHYAIALARDITERKRVERSLRRTAETLRKALHMASMGSWSFDAETSAFLVSREAQDIIGWDNHPRGLRELVSQIPEVDRPRVIAAWTATLEGAPYEIEHRILVEGRIKWVSVRAEPERDAAGKIARIKGITQDVTARRALEEQLRHAQKMEALGRLAGGVAHDFNNILTVIEGYCENVVEDSGAGPEVVEQVTAIRDAARRAASLTRQLLAFSKGHTETPTIVDPGAPAETPQLLSRLIGEAPQTAPPSVRRTEPAHRGTETILLAEDEPGVRRLAERALRAHGYRVLTAEHGADALRVLDGYTSPIHLLLTDVAMPVMGGRELVDAVRARLAGVRVLFMSGYTDDALLDHGVRAGDAVLSKPFMPRDLVARVRAVLDAPVRVATE